MGIGVKSLYLLDFRKIYLRRNIMTNLFLAGKDDTIIL